MSIFETQSGGGDDSRESKSHESKPDGCAFCGMQLHERSVTSCGPMSLDELFSRTAGQAQAGRAMVCEPCGVELCAMCCVEAAASKAASTPLCPLCGNQVHLRGAIVFPAVGVICDRCNGDMTAENACGISPQAAIPRGPHDVYYVYCRECAREFFRRNTAITPSLLDESNRMAIEHLRATGRL
jgi:hypothetical protein